jgi:hypothetical protein
MVVKTIIIWPLAWAEDIQATYSQLLFRQGSSVVQGFPRTFPAMAVSFRASDRGAARPDHRAK